MIHMNANLIVCVSQMTGVMYMLKRNVIPASEARRESLREARKDSGQAGMTELSYLIAGLIIIAIH